MSASQLEAVEQRDRRANELRATLKGLASEETRARLSEAEFRASLERVDESLEFMTSDLLERVDRTPIAEMRAAAAGASTSGRRDLLALADSIATGREGLRSRLPRLELLITVLATEDADHDRKIVHDPVSLSPTIAALVAEQESSEEAELLALEFYQAASTGEAQDDLAALRMRRARKDAIGLACLSPNVLRAIVTYNARVFNRLASGLNSSREADALLEEMVREPIGQQASAGDEARWGILDESDEIWARIGVPNEAESVFESNGVDAVIEALRRLVGGVPVGSCATERIVLALDVARLEDFERQALETETPSPEQDLVLRTAVVGLLLRDVGVVRSQLSEVGIDEAVLRRAWLREVEQALSRLISEKIADVEQYALASVLSGIKTKHLLAPLQRLREESGPTQAAAEKSSPADDEAPATSEVRRKAPPSARPQRAATLPPAPAMTNRLRELFAGQRGLAIAVALVLLPILIFGMNRLTAAPTNVSTLDRNELASLSPYLSSAYRSDHGQGPILIGRVDGDFARLSPNRKIAVARDLAERAARLGVGEVMAYGSSGRLRVHYVNGELRRPHL